jgi:hypothetical protein
MGIGGVCMRNRCKAEEWKRRVISSRNTGSRFLARIALWSWTFRFPPLLQPCQDGSTVAWCLACQRKDRTRNVSCTHLDDAALVAGVVPRTLEAHTNDPRNMTGYFLWIKSMGSDEGNARPST